MRHSRRISGVPGAKGHASTACPRLATGQTKSNWQKLRILKIETDLTKSAASGLRTVAKGLVGLGIAIAANDLFKDAEKCGKLK